APFRPVFSAETPVADAGQLQVQTPLDASATVSAERPVPANDETTDQTTLFDDRGALRPDARQMIRHEVADEEPRKFDWREISLYVVMSGFGLVTFGLAIAAFRTASQGAGRTDFTTIAWVLAVLGFASIAVSAWNLYRKLGRHEA
ncbi:MAG: glycoside hydrolase family 24, partial [Brevundimonas sp.]|nr:glycoside hydrolase family 24 [Brevundimonas sp.]